MSGIPNYHRPPPSDTNEEKITRLRPEQSKNDNSNNINNDEHLSMLSSTSSSTTSIRIPIHTVEGNEINHEASILSPKVSSNQQQPSQEIAMTLVPIVAVFVLLLAIGTAFWSLKDRLCVSQKSKESTVTKIKSL